MNSGIPPMVLRESQFCFFGQMGWLAAKSKPQKRWEKKWKFVVAIASKFFFSCKDNIGKEDQWEKFLIGKRFRVKYSFECDVSYVSCHWVFIKHCFCKAVNLSDKCNFLKSFSNSLTLGTFRSSALWCRRGNFVMRMD